MNDPTWDNHGWTIYQILWCNQNVGFLIVDHLCAHFSFHEARDWRNFYTFRVPIFKGRSKMKMFNVVICNIFVTFIIQWERGKCIQLLLRINLSVYWQLLWSLSDLPPLPVNWFVYIYGSTNNVHLFIWWFFAGRKFKWRFVLPETSQLEINAHTTYPQRTTGYGQFFPSNATANASPF